MADTFVSAFWGNDSNDGLTVATAKATIQAGIAAGSSGSTVFVYPGIYNESFTVTGTRTFEGIGKVIVDGQNTLTIGISFSGVTINILNLEVKNYTTGINTSGDVRLTNCVVHDCQTGMTTFVNSPIMMNNCTIYNCSTGVLGPRLLTNKTHSIIRNTIYNCGTGYTALEAAAITRIIKFIENIIDNCDTSFKFTGTQSSLILQTLEMNTNLYNIPSGGTLIDTSDVDHTTLASWQSASNSDLQSQETDPLFTNPDNGIFSIAQGSPAESGSLTGGYVGSHFTEFGYPTETLLQTNAILVNTETVTFVATSGIQLTTDSTVGTAELTPIEIPSGYTLIDILDVFTEQFPNALVDSDTSDNAITSGELTLEFRSAAVSGDLSSEAYLTYNMRTEVPVLSGNFLQFKLTLNK